MEPYLFQGLVLPERAQISFSFEAGVQTAEEQFYAEISVVNNQAAIWIHTSKEWDIFDLRNVVRDIVEPHLGAVTYLTGNAYDFEVTRVLNKHFGVDYVFGIDVPCITDRAIPRDQLPTALGELRSKMVGPHAVFLNRCFGDLVSATKHPADTGFYCYRALESLRSHCAAMHGMSDDRNKRGEEWLKFRGVAGCTEEAIMGIKAAADPVRHGGAVPITSVQRAALLTQTWDIVGAYLQAV